MALPYLIKNQIRQERYENYIAENLRMIGENTARAVREGVYTKATLQDILDPKPKDERTGDEIVADVIKRLELKFESDTKV